MGFADRLSKQFETDTLPPHIEAQRWYATKGSRIDRAQLGDNAIWQIDGYSWMLPLLSLKGPPEPATYFMPLALAWEDTDEDRMKALQPAAIAKVRQQAHVGVMADAFFDVPFCRAFVRAIVRDTKLPTARGQLHFRPTALGREFPIEVIDDLPVGAPSPVSSNTVVTLGETLFLKGYRNVRPGVNPELEMGRFLTEDAGFVHGVPIAGALEYTGTDGTVMTLALLQAYVPNQGDGWEYTLGYLERVLAEIRDTNGHLPPDPHGAFLALIRILGARTAELHNALGLRTGNAAFDPEPMTDADLRHVRETVRAEAVATLRQLGEADLSALPTSAREDAVRLHGMAEAINRFVDSMALEAKAAWRTRFHGDYHLGQVLLTRNDFVIIDFEGEPARPIEERRTKQSPLRDVAGMLRSFNYARWSALRRAAQNADELIRLDTAAKGWEHATREAFLAGYSQALASAAGPMDMQLLELFELEKAFYELRYELNNRIDWAPVPLTGILALLDRTAVR
ncbi:putative maltokinase [Variovorax sp. GT1P44]|uniref:putative maltokinase n=1 Tax=Variovorax sp. GT1P44 TaxID=3443742 RepID=UPI003F45F445